jgi:hypothetical protein
MAHVDRLLHGKRGAFGSWWRAETGAIFDDQVDIWDVLALTAA